MANIPKLEYANGLQGTDATCGEASVYDLRNYIQTVFTMAPSARKYENQDASGADNMFATVPNLKCGAGYLLSLNKTSNWTSFNVPHFVLANTANRVYRMTTLFPESFEIQGYGKFHLTSGEYNASGLAWYENYPVYKTENGSLVCWYDGSQYRISGVIGSTSSSVGNGSKIPNAPYTTSNEPTTSSLSIEITNFTGSCAEANGFYYEVGYLKSNKVYRHAKTGKYFYYFDGSRWVFTDTPFNLSGLYVMGTSSLTGALDNTNGSNGSGCAGMRGLVSDGSVDPRSLATESEEHILSTEDEKSVMITESNL